MARLRGRTPQILIGATGLLILLGAPAGASLELRDTRDERHTVSTRDAGVDISMGYVIVDGTIRARPGQRTPTGPGGCEMTVERIPALEAIPIAPDIFDDAIDVRVTCGPDGRDQDLWVAIPDADNTAHDLARDHAERVLAPQITLATSPPANILVGLPTWFWLDGWDGTTRTTTVTAPWGDALDLTLTLQDITWDFGDGTPTQLGGIGQPYPTESDIQHTYTHRSTSPTNPDATYPLTAHLTIAVSYTYDGQGPITVDPIELTIEHPITVHQLQAVIRN